MISGVPDGNRSKARRAVLHDVMIHTFGGRAERLDQKDQK